MSARPPRPSTLRSLSQLRPSTRLTSRTASWRNQSSFAAAISAARQILSNKHDPNAPISFDPLRAVANEMRFLTKNIQALLGSGHPLLDKVAKYYTQSEGKYVRPTLVLLMSRATALAPKSTRDFASLPDSSIDTPFAPFGLLNDNNPDAPNSHTPISAPSAHSEALYSQQGDDATIRPSQRRLAEITELIHTASLLHDDVLDTSESRRSNPSANIAFGNKLAVLAGDFLLGRASVALARLRDPEVTELLATVIANLVEGEFMQLRNTEKDDAYPTYSPDALTYYLQKTYLKSASLISKSCRAAALLGECAPSVVDAAYSYGKNLGLAFQLVDDMLDYTISAGELGKPAGADLQLGLATAPLLFAWESNAQLGELVGRHFSREGDVERARDFVLQSNGLEQTRALAQSYVDRAVDSIKEFPESEAKEGLVEMCHKVMKRRK